MQENAKCPGCHTMLNLKVPKDLPPPEAGLRFTRANRDPLCYSYRCPHCKAPSVLVGWGYEYRGDLRTSFLFSELRDEHIAKRREALGLLSLDMLERVFESSLVISWITTCVSMGVWGGSTGDLSMMLFTCGMVFVLPIFISAYELLTRRLPNLSVGAGALLLSLGWWLFLSIFREKTELIIGAGNLFFWWLTLGVFEYNATQKRREEKLGVELARMHEVEVLLEDTPYRAAA